MPHLSNLPHLSGVYFPRFGGHGRRSQAQHDCTMNPAGKKRRTYDEKFKRAAVEMYLNGQRSAPAVARDLGIARRSLHLWVKEINPSGKPMPESPAQLQAQLRSARAE